MKYWGCFFLTLFSPLAFGQAAIDTAWLPISDDERTMKAPIVEKDAGVEALFWRVHIRDEVIGGRDLQRVFYNYVRLKIFDEKGKEKAATIDLPFTDDESVTSVNGRTIKADGTELELKKDSVYERDLVRAGHRKIRVKSFAMPGVEPGAIVEYRWREVQNNPRFLYTRLQFQREFPVQKVTYFISPLSNEYDYKMSFWPFHCEPSPPKHERDGFQSTTVENIPAFKEEPLMPGEANVRPWALIYYHKDDKRSEDKYWNDVGKQIYNDTLKPALKASGEVKEAAHAAVQGANTDEEKVLALIRYIRKNLRDLFGSQVTEVERAKILKQLEKSRERTSGEVFKSGIGTASELNILFASMASVVGLEARPALVADADDILFVPAMTDRYFLRNIDMAVNIGGKWQLFDVSTRLLPSNMLSWREQGMQALVSDPKKPFFIESPASPAEASAARRVANFVLSDDGDLEGDVNEQYSGQMALDRRSELFRDSAERRLEREKEDLRKVFTDAEVSEVKIENVDDPEQPLVLAYHIKVSGYAQRTGKRILLQPMFFQRGETPMFTASERKYPIRFHYGWEEHDKVTIELPEGFDLDHPEAPDSMTFGEPGGYNVRMALQPGRKLVCGRDLAFGKGGLLGYSAEIYPKLKHVFDEIQRRDDQTIALKVDAKGASR